MARTLKDVTDAELKVLEALWRRSPATIRRITDELYPEGTASHYATVQKLLERLAAKGLVARRRQEGAWAFEAAVSRAELIDRQLQATADKLCEGSLTPLLTHLAERAPLTARDLAKLRDLVDELDRKRGRKKKGRGGREGS